MNATNHAIVQTLVGASLGRGEWGCECLLGAWPVGLRLQGVWLVGVRVAFTASDPESEQLSAQVCNDSCGYLLYKF